MESMPTLDLNYLLGGAVVVLVGTLVVGCFVNWQTEQKRKEDDENLKAAQANQNLANEGALFQLYNEQLRIYQSETRTRARNSFFWAIFAMMVGFAVLAAGAILIVTHPTQEGVLSGSSLAAIGGALSAFITKTLLDVHKVSLEQLNRYFKQPVLNSHILTCQRLIKAIPPDLEHFGLYKLVVQAVVALLAAEQTQSVILSAKGVPTSSGTKDESPDQGGAATKQSGKAIEQDQARPEAKQTKA
jgi:hypothetical protein